MDELAIDLTDLNAIRNAVVVYPASFKYNAERDAIQILRHCDDAIVLSVKAPVGLREILQGEPLSKE
jgi:hypothetical protein